MSSGRRALAIYRVLVINNLKCCRNCNSKQRACQAHWVEVAAHTRAHRMSLG